MITLTVGELKDRLERLPDDMEVLIPVIKEDDCNNIIALRRVKTLGILKAIGEEDALCLNASTDDIDISDQVNKSTSIDASIECVQVLF
jgi:hypothetical protein